MPLITEKVRVRKAGRGQFKVVGHAGRKLKLTPKDILKHQGDPVGAEFDVMVPVVSPAGRMTKRR